MKARSLARLALLLLACASASGCGTRGCSSRSSSPDAGAGPVVPGWPKLRPLPPLVESFARRKGEGDLVTATRLLIPHPATGDGFSVVLAWEGPDDRPIAKSHPLAARSLDLNATLRSLVVRVRSDAGAERVFEVAAAAANRRDGWQLSEFRGIGLTFDGAGVRVGSTQAPLWPYRVAGDLTPTAGRHVVKLSGQLHLSGGAPIPFESGELTLEASTQGAGRLSLGDLEGRASAAVASQLALGAPPPPAKPSVEDAAGNRVVRFAIHDAGGEYSLHQVELVLSPAGALLSGDLATVFTCVAEGTPIETPGGRRAVESLAPGDPVLSFDVARGVRVVTRVRQATRSYAPRTVRLGELRVTRRHPVFADGAFTEAGALRAGARLLDTSLEPVRLTDALEPAGAAWVVELAVDWPHDYFAGGILVHNKIAETPSGRAATSSDWEGIAARPQQAPAGP